jgi:imidazolonepropionase-like amidohydrolase
VPDVLTAPRVMTGEETVTDGAVVIDDTVVRWVGAATALPDEYAMLPRTAHADATILAGLIDCHVHLGFDGGPNPVARMRAESDEQQLILMLHRARELLGVGVTSARDLGGRGFLSVAVRDAIAAGLARGPRLVVAASPITITGGHCWFMGGEADSDDDIRRVVRTHHKHGADLIKVMLTGGFMTKGSAPWHLQFTASQLAMIVEEAARIDMPVAVHAHGVEGVRRAVEAGAATIEHCTFGGEANKEPFDVDLAVRMAEQGTFVCPTVSVNAPYFAAMTGVGAHVHDMHKLGVRIIAGTDAGIHKTPHHQYVGGLEYLVTLGFTPAEVLAMATTEAAAALGLGTTTGRLAPGYDADLIVVTGDPGVDIAALGHLRRVVTRGRDYVPDDGRFDVSAPGTPFATSAPATNH